MEVFMNSVFPYPRSKRYNFKGLEKRKVLVEVRNNFKRLGLNLKGYLTLFTKYSGIFLIKRELFVTFGTW